MEKIKIFVAYGWEEGEEKISDFILDILSTKEIFEVITAKIPKVDLTLEKLCQFIDVTDVTVLIFLKRYRASRIEKTRLKSFLPSLYVVSESGFALGRYFNFRDFKKVVVLYEKGVNPRELGMINDTGLSFEEINLENEATRKLTKERLDTYFDDLILKLRGTVIEKSPTKQQSVFKDWMVFQNGNAVVRNKVVVRVRDGQTFTKEPRIPQTIFSTIQLRPMVELLKADIDFKAEYQFFKANLLRINKDSQKVSLNVIERAERKGFEIPIYLIFPQKTYRTNDELEYEYIWGVAKLYCELSPNEKLHWAEFRTPYGVIPHVYFGLNFEKGYKFGIESTPFYQIAEQVLEIPIFQSEKYVFDFSNDLSCEKFCIDKKNFFGTIKGQWA